jgi:hypothetical protein
MSCGHKDKTPSYVLSPVKMRMIFSDAFKADEMAGYYMIHDSSYSGLKKHAEMYNTIFKIHHVSKDQFKRSLEYYETHPTLLKAMLDSMQVITDSTIKHTLPKQVKPLP